MARYRSLVKCRHINPEVDGLNPALVNFFIVLPQHDLTFSYSSQLVLDLHQEVEQHDQGIVSIDMQLRAFWRSITYGDRWRAGRVLLTGATGFLGVYILRDLLSSTQVSINGNISFLFRF